MAKISLVRYTTKEELGGVISPRVFTDVSCILTRSVSDSLGLRAHDPSSFKVLGQLVGLSYALEKDVESLAAASRLAEGEGSEENGSGNGHDSFLSPIAMNALESGCVRARNLPNGGLRFELLGSQEENAGDEGPSKDGSRRKTTGRDSNEFITVRVTMVGHTDFGGWLPTRVINGATGGAFLDIFTTFTDYLASIQGVECARVVES